MMLGEEQGGDRMTPYTGRWNTNKAEKVVPLRGRGKESARVGVCSVHTHKKCTKQTYRYTHTHLESV